MASVAAETSPAERCSRYCKRRHRLTSDEIRVYMQFDREERAAESSFVDRTTSSGGFKLEGLVGH